jgi:peptide deformylase
MIIKVPDIRLETYCEGVKLKDGQNISRRLRQEWAAYQKEHRDQTVIGLAAPQIGVTKNVFVAMGEVFINPHIMSQIEETGPCKEWCCSLPDSEMHIVERPLELKLSWTNYQGRLVTHTFYEVGAAIISHEMDHLKGVTIRDRTPLPEMRKADKTAVQA